VEYEKGKNANTGMLIFGWKFIIIQKQIIPTANCGALQ